MVNILRVQSWDQQTLNGATSQGDGIGGTAVSVMQLVENNHNVVAVYGDTSDLSTKLSAQMLSQFKIPMCGGVQNLPQLSDKNNFPYFFRSSGSGKWGRDFSVILTKWKIKRVSIVYDADDIDSVGACLDVKTYLFQNNIIVLSNRGYRGNNPHVNFQDIASELVRVDARYVILCAQSWSSSYGLIDAANQTGLISPNHVWFATNAPFPSDYGGGDDPRLANLMGMIVPTPDFQLMSDPDFVSILNTWQSVYHANPLKYQTDSLSWAVTGSYDCVGTMLYGIDKFLKSDTGVSPQMLSRARRLNLTSFANSGFHATALSPMILDSNGDVAANTVFLALNSSFWMEGSQPYFATVDKFTGNLTLKADPIFFGGISILALE
ncbi:hypothetical protein HDU79_000003 [Rhizoclosmatium sp. JEL0117]|nr:hypothetical protein HDU79_000003 [Rhizoclosmatium sp. JEL0117]